MRTKKFEITIFQGECFMDNPHYDFEKYGVTDDWYWVADILSEFKDIDIPDEQYELLVELYSDYHRDKEFAEINEYFKRLFDELTKPLLARVEQLYRDYGYSDDVIENEMRWVGASVSPVFGDDLRMEKDVVDTRYEGGILYEILRDGRHRIVTCTDKNIEILNSDAHIIAPHAFSHCSRLKEVYLPNVTKIDECAFVDCMSLRTVELSSAIKSIESDAFSGCYFLRDVSLPEGLERIGSSAFYGCPHLNPSITLPTTVKHIGNDAFAYSPLERFSNNTMYLDAVGKGDVEYEEDDDDAEIN